MSVGGNTIYFRDVAQVCQEHLHDQEEYEVQSHFTTLKSNIVCHLLEWNRLQMSHRSGYLEHMAWLGEVNPVNMILMQDYKNLTILGNWRLHHDEVGQGGGRRRRCKIRGVCLEQQSGERHSLCNLVDVNCPAWFRSATSKILNSAHSYLGKVTRAVSPILLAGKADSHLWADLQSPNKHCYYLNFSQ